MSKLITKIKQLAALHAITFVIIARELWRSDGR